MTTTPDFSRVCVLLPAYNEAHHIGPCIDDVRQAFPGARILVLDNNSSDGTADVARAAGADVMLERRQGKGFAVTMGIRKALEDGSEWVALHDADREYSATHLARLVQRCQEEGASTQASMVMGVGLREVMLGRVLWRSLLANFVARYALRIATGRRPPDDILTGARVMSRPLAGALFKPEQAEAPYRGFELETALTRRAMNLGALIVDSRVRYSPRVVAEKKIKATDMFGILKAAFHG